MATVHTEILEQPKDGSKENNFRLVTTDGVFDIWKYLPHSNELGHAAVSGMNKVIKAVKKATDIEPLQLVAAHEDGNPTDDQLLYIGLVSEEIRSLKKGSYTTLFVPANKAGKPYSMAVITQMIEKHRKLIDTFLARVPLEDRKEYQLYRARYENAIKFIRAQI